MVTEDIVCWRAGNALVDGDLFSYGAIGDRNIEKARLEVFDGVGRIQSVPSDLERGRPIVDPLTDEGVGKRWRKVSNPQDATSCLRSKRPSTAEDAIVHNLTLDEPTLTSTAVADAELNVGGCVSKTPVINRRGGLGEDGRKERASTSDGKDSVEGHHCGSNEEREQGTVKSWVFVEVTQDEDRE